MFGLTKRYVAASSALPSPDQAKKKRPQLSANKRKYSRPITISFARNDNVDIIDVKATTHENPAYVIHHGEELTTSSSPVEPASSSESKVGVILSSEIENPSSAAVVEENVEEELAAYEEARVQDLKQQLVNKINLLMSGRFDQSSMEMTETEGASEGSTGDAESSPKVKLRGTSVSKLIAISTLALFAIQWWPMVSVLIEGIRTLNPEVCLAFLLALPETDVVMSWKLVRRYTLLI
jgi:hypothetical protein